PHQSPGVSKGARRTWGKAGGPEAPNRLPDGSRCKERGRSNTVCIASPSDAADAAGWQSVAVLKGHWICPSRAPRLGISGGFFGFLPQAKPTQSVGSA